VHLGLVGGISVCKHMCLGASAPPSRPTLCGVAKRDAHARQDPELTPASTSPPDPDDKPVLPTKSQEDTDAGWGERPEPDDDERLYRERPPHWDSA